MSTTDVTPDRRERTTPGSAGWSTPVRVVAVTALVATALLQLGASLLGQRWSSREEMVAAVAADPSSADLASALLVLSMPLALAVVAVKVALSWRGSRRWAVTGVVLASAGLLGSAVVAGMELVVVNAAASGVSAQDVVLADGRASLPVVVAAVMFIPCSVLGYVALVVAMWRARTVPVPVLLVLIAYLLLDTVLDQPRIGYGASLLAAGGLAWTVWTGTYLRTRRSRRRTPSGTDAVEPAAAGS